MYQKQPARFTAPVEASTSLPADVHDVLRSPGQPLDEATQASMGRAFDHDFSQVRVHTDARAAASADAVHAHAYTVGRHVVFGEGEYRPHERVGQQLLVHELSHVLQQGAPGGSPALQRFPREGTDPLHQGIVENWRTARGLPAAGVDETGQRVGPSAGEIKYSLNQPLSAKSPFELAQTSAIEFSVQQPAASSPGAGPSLEDYRRARTFVRNVLARHGYTFDFERDHRPLGKLPSADEMKIANRLFGQVLRVPGVAAGLSAPGARRVPTAPGSQTPTLEGKVRIFNDATEYSIKRYQLNLLVTGQMHRPAKELDGLVRKEWPTYGITAAGAQAIVTEQERRAYAVVELQVHAGSEPGFYMPPDDTFYLSPSANLSDPQTQETLRHESAHLLGGRERSRDAFYARFPDRQVAFGKWRTFEEGMAELINLKAAGRAPCGRGPVPTASQYAAQVTAMCQIMADPRIGERAVYNAYFTGQLPEILLRLVPVIR